MDSTKKLGLTFHRTFKFVKPAVSQVLNVAYEWSLEHQGEEALTLDTVRSRTNLGTIYVEAMPRYAKAMGLLNDAMQPTAFGRSVLAHDPFLRNRNTLWLLHYHMSTPFGVGPAFWNYLVSFLFRSGQQTTREQVQGLIADFVSDSEDRTVASRDAETSANAFLRTYLEADALGELGILEETQEGYQILEPEPPSAWVVGYALIDYWEARFAQQVSVSLSELTGGDGITGLFLIGQGRLNRVLRTLEMEGIVEVHRVSPPYRVVLLNRDRPALLEKIYSHDVD